MNTGCPVTHAVTNAARIVENTIISVVSRKMASHDLGEQLLAPDRRNSVNPYTEESDSHTHSDKKYLKLHWGTRSIGNAFFYMISWGAG